MGFYIFPRKGACDHKNFSIFTNQELFNTLRYSFDPKLINLLPKVSTISCQEDWPFRLAPREDIDPSNVLSLVKHPSFFYGNHRKGNMPLQSTLLKGPFPKSSRRGKVKGGIEPLESTKLISMRYAFIKSKKEVNSKKPTIYFLGYWKIFSKTVIFNFQISRSKSSNDKSKYTPLSPPLWEITLLGSPIKGNCILRIEFILVSYFPF